MSLETEFYLKTLLNFLVVCVVCVNTLVITLLLFVTNSVGAFLVMRVACLLVAAIIVWWFYRLGKNVRFYFMGVYS